MSLRSFATISTTTLNRERLSEEIKQYGNHKEPKQEEYILKSPNNRHIHRLYKSCQKYIKGGFLRRSREGKNPHYEYKINIIRECKRSNYEEKSEQ